MSDSPEPLLPETIGDRYRIQREIGRGGMACVYLARDTKHQRDVAIKVIRSDFSAAMGGDRFLREIEIAAKLRHPNIVPLYDSGQVSGTLYFVMPYEEGHSLREQLAERGALPLTEAMNTLRDVARALAYAHDHGVVHRDVKPDNVMLSGGAAVVTDFGIAKAVRDAMTDPGATTLTQTGAGIGTPAYMAPEQAIGARVDHRADLYSFGCLAFELFTGRPPFHGLPGNQVIASHMTVVPPAIADVRSEVPGAVSDLVARCLEKDPAKRPADAREVLRVLEGGSVPAAGSTQPAWRDLRTARRLKIAGIALLLAISVATAALLMRGPERGPITLAVLPFGHAGVDSAMEGVIDGLTDEVASALARVPGLQVKSRIGSQIYRDVAAVDLAEAGERLKADYLMTGVVRHVGGRWTLSAEFTRVSDATSLWVESFNLSPERTAGAAHAIASSLITELRDRFSDVVGAAPELAASQQTSNGEAYRLYLRGQEKLSRRGGSVEESARLFRQAISLDPQFAPAHSGLSMALALFPYFQRTPPREIRAELVRAAEQALALDPTLAQPRIALALAHWYDYRWEEAEAELQQAIRLDPRNVEARVQYARHLMFTGRRQEAPEQLRAARAVDPASALVLSWVAYSYYLDGQLDSALAESRRALDTDSSNYSSVVVGGLIRLATARPREARRLVERSPRFFLTNEFVLARAGDSATARRQLAEVEATSPRPWLAESRRAYAYLGLGDTSAMLSALERATDNNEIWYVVFSADDPIFDPVRASERYRTVLRRLRLGQLVR